MGILSTAYSNSILNENPDVIVRVFFIGKNHQYKEGRDWLFLKKKLMKEYFVCFPELYIIYLC